MPRELWSLSGSYWVIPCSVEWRGDTGLIRVGAGLRLLDVQRKTAADRLKVIGAEWRENRWHLLKANLERFCKPEGDEDPQAVLEWRPPWRVNYRTLKSKGMSQERTERYRNRDEFFHELAKSGWFKSPQSAETLFMAICKHMLYTLANGKPVDLGFAQICPVPLRANWKALLLHSHLKNGGAPIWGFNKRLLQMVDQEVTRPEYLAWDRPTRLVWGLEVLPDIGWRRASAKVARRYWRKPSFQQFVPLLTRLYAAYLSNIKLPGVRLMAVILPSGKASPKLSDRRAASVRVDPPDLVPERYDARFSPPVTTAEGLETPNGQDTHLRGMSDLRQKAEDLRGAEC